jgi:hypothetical protein
LHLPLQTEFHVAAVWVSTADSGVYLPLALLFVTLIIALELQSVFCNVYILVILVKNSNMNFFVNDLFLLKYLLRSTSIQFVRLNVTNTGLL